MKRMVGALIVALALGAFSTPGALAAPSTQWVAASGDLLTNVGGYGIAQYRDAYYESTDAGGQSTGDWALTASAGTVVIGGTSSQLWLLDGRVTFSTTFSVQSTAVAFMMTGDWNDGYADFLVDGATVLADFNLNMLGDKSLIVSGLDLGTHTIGVRHLDIVGGSDFGCPAATGIAACDHVALFGGAALVPAPATLALLGIGLAGIGVARRRKAR